jgi:hypothetical protein
MSVNARVAACTRIFRNAGTDRIWRHGAGTFRRVELPGPLSHGVRVPYIVGRLAPPHFSGQERTYNLVNQRPCSMSDNRKKAEDGASSGEPQQEREREPGNTDPFGAERYQASNTLPAHEQARRAYAAALSANDLQRRRIYAASLTGASSIIVPPQRPPENPQPVLSAGVPSTVVTNISARRPAEVSFGDDQNVTVIPTVVRATSPNWPEERAEIIRRLEAAEATFQKIAPFLAALEAAYGERGQLGHNNPPERVEMLPLETIELQTGSEAAKLARAEISSDNPRLDVLRVCGLVLNQVAARAHACLSWIGAKGDEFVDACVKSAGDQTGKLLVTAVAASQLLQQLHIDLTAIVTQILHILMH